MKKKTLLEAKKKLLCTSLALSTIVAPLSIKNNVNASSLNTSEIEYDHNSRPISVDEAIYYYCKVFELKYDVIRAKIYEMMNPYAWRYGTSINGRCYDSEEQAILMVVRDIYNNPEDYDLTYDEINSGVAYEPTMKPEEMIYKYSHLYGINKDIALSIAYCECGTDMGSDNYLYNNNPAGIGPFYHFLNKEEGIIYYCNMLKYGYGCSENSDASFFYNIASTYCETPEHWLNLTVPIYNGVSNDYLCYVDDRDSYDVNDYETDIVNIKSKTFR